MASDYTQMSDKITTGVAYTASAGAVFFGLTVNEFAAMAGVLIATLTFCLNAWFKWKHFELAREKRKGTPSLTKEEENDYE